MCPDGWALTSSGCKACPEENVLAPSRNAAIAIFVLFVLGTWISLSWLPMRSTPQDIHSNVESSKDAPDQINSSVKSAKGQAKGSLQFLKKHSQSLSPYLKLYITFFQVLSSFITFNVVWPPFLLNIMSWIKGTLFLDVVNLPGLSCLWRGVSFQSRLTSYTLGSLFVIVLLLIPVLVNMVIIKFESSSNHDDKRTERVISSAWKNIMFWVFLIYPVVSLSTLEAFNCQPFGLGKLAADFNEPCPGQTHLLRIWSYIFIAVFPVGIPLFCYWSMLKMGVHLVARDVKCSFLLKSLLMEYASLSLCSTSEEVNPKEINQLVADSTTGIKITKPQAVDILMTFEILDFNSRKSKEESSGSNKAIQGKNVSKSTGIFSTCISAPQIADSESDSTELSLKMAIRKRLEKAATKNPSFFSSSLLKLAKKLVQDNCISIPSTSWRGYKESLEASESQNKIEPQTAVTQICASDLSAEHSCGFDTSSVNIDLESLYAIHPDLDDDQTWGFWIKLQNSFGTLLMGIPESWKSFNKRKALGGKAIDRVGFVFAAYKVDFWFWEMLEMTRK